MDLLLILTYAALCVAIFKIFHIPLNKWTVPTAVLGGILIIGALIFTMNYNHPYSEVARYYFVSVPVIPVVSGQVIEVPVKGNELIQKGDILFRIDPTPFTYRVKSIKAQLIAAKGDRARITELIKRSFGTQRELEATIARTDDLQAQLDHAQYELDNTIVRAPSKGFVAQVSLRPGMMATKLPLRPSMIFIPDEGQYFAAWMRQNSLLRLVVGDEAEVAFDGIPGKVFKGKVASVLSVIGEGQVQPSGTLTSYTGSPPPGRVPVVIEINDPDFTQYRDFVPGGAYGQAAVYSQHFHHIGMMRKILLRMAAWMNYIFPFH
ncbi:MULTISPECIES: HlyD family secretion protein [Pseudomonas]|uniref:HlyD family secretion protein n=1 Tax=Pseudomonas TaxID=286 RepID=UPI000876120F|nr:MULTISPECIES: biotin/lipoyl-binding protein [Pseudomonas]MDB6442389.1 biotin/lipoyl-binding protein [Pseudomonas sp. 21TX0197]MDT8905778.1 biotin/lipoyl-binding protein [Pseudomonas prosekii]NHN68029.1 HlyD family secretion protein [Pseudomonas fluorescens]ROO34798.1 efflux transporter periplasmic adaptor subunit [Pseudomonas sp. 7SR1]ROO42370.1 efflux transporter periplasmic adaptor subunit [Pseudomonas sp. AF76]